MSAVINYRHRVRQVWIIVLGMVLAACSVPVEKKPDSSSQMNVGRLMLDIEEANRLVELPLTCIDIQYPNKLGQVIESEQDLLPPKILHPAFYGCFDWHSAVHGHWSLVRLINAHPDLNKRDEVLEALTRHVTAANIEKELDYFKGSSNGSFERMYGWAWLLKLAEELQDLKAPEAQELQKNIEPLANLIAGKAREFLPKLKYPIRVGTHTNTAFAMTMIYDYAIAYGDDELRILVGQRARDFYLEDTNCPLNWEPSGYDFLSPCLEEADIMRRVLPEDAFRGWLRKFLPQLAHRDFQLEPGVVADRKDGHLVHLDGLNFSRAWCLYGIAATLPEFQHLVQIANDHINYSLPGLVGDGYEGGHWLASFALLALDSE